MTQALKIQSKYFLQILSDKNGWCFGKMSCRPLNGFRYFESPKCPVQICQALFNAISSTVHFL